MRLTVWDPLRDLAALQRALDSVFISPFTRGRQYYPPIELINKDDSIMLIAELPGVEKDKIELIALGDTLTIAGEKKIPAEEGVNYIRHERAHGKFRRQIDLPCSVNQDKISATYKDGILIVTLPKCEEAKPRQIAIE